MLGHLLLAVGHFEFKPFVNLLEVLKLESIAIKVCLQTLQVVQVLGLVVLRQVRQAVLSTDFG